MKRKLVLWGENENNEKKLLALELLEEENAVNIHSFSQEIATQEFYNEMMDKWRGGGEVAFPEGYETIKRSLKVSESVLPEELKVERTDLITRAQAEWHFIVLSSKLYEIYNTELSEIEEKIENAEEFKNSLWDEMKSYWDKVSAQVHERNLFREHGDSLKARTNKAFDKLKAMRKKLEAKFEEESSEVKAKFLEELAVIEEKIEKKLGLKPLFNELKNLQNRLRKAKLTRSDNNTVWNKIDKAFKNIKEIKYGTTEGKPTSGLSRVQNRYDGLLNAIQKMERSIKRDRNDLDFQDKRMSKTDGQLEMQLRQAKAKVIEERVNSKQEKLDDMMKTKAMLEEKMAKEKEKEAQKLEQAKIEEAKKAAKEKIAATIEEQKEKTEEISDKLEEAAAEIKGKAADVTETTKEKVEETAADATETVAEKKEEVKEAAEEVKDDAEETAQSVSEKISNAVAGASTTIAEMADNVEDKAEDILDKLEDGAEDVLEKIEDVAEQAKEKIKNIVDDLIGEEE